MASHLPLSIVALLAFAGAVRADDMAPAQPPAGGAAPAAPAAGAPAAQPGLVSDEDAVKAIAAFKEAWKSKGLKGDERMSQRDWALDELSKLQHPLVVAEIGGVARAGGDDDLRLMAVIYLARQSALPGAAGEQALLALQKHPKDIALVLSALQTLGKLKYLGADEQMKDLLKSDDWAVRKYTITTVGQVGDMRLLEALLKLLGIDIKAAAPAPGEEKKGGKEVVEEGYSYEGAEATVDHGDADNSKENAEAKAKAEAQIAKNKAAAGGAGGGGGGAGGGGVGGGGSTGGRGGSARSPSELKPYVLKSLKSLTGETFTHSREIYLWIKKNAALIESKKKECDAAEIAQKAAAKK